MGKANLYTVTDCQTGEVLAKGTAGELEASGIVPKGYHTSEWAKRENNRTMGRKYNISSELLHPEDKPRRGEKGRALHKARHRKNDLPKRGAAGQYAQCPERKAAQAEEQKAEAAGAAADQGPDAAGLRRPRPDDLQRHRQKRGPTGADLRLLGGGGKAGETMRAPCRDCLKRHPLCHDQCEAYRRWKEEKAKEVAYTKQKKEDGVIHRRDFDKEFWM